MKRIIITLILAMIYNLSYCQLTNTIWGCTLGKSSVQQVKSNLAAKGINIYLSKDGDINYRNVESLKVYYSKQPLEFGGFNWDGLYIRFFRGKLLSISFRTLQRESSILGEYKDSESYRFEKELSKKIDKKYKSYRRKSDYYDGKTTIAIGTTVGTFDDGKRLWYLDYEDVKLSKELSKCALQIYRQKRQKDFDEL